MITAPASRIILYTGVRTCTHIQMHTHMRMQAEAAAGLLRALCDLLARSVRPPFDLTLLNAGATAFHEERSGGSSSSVAAPIERFFSRLPAAGGLTAATAAPSTQPCTQQAAAAGEQGGASVGQAAARASLMQRRTYGGGASAAVVSKRQERALREGGAPVGGHTGTGTVGTESGAAAPSYPWEGVENEREEEDEEEGADGCWAGGGGDVWEELRGLSSFNSAGPASCPPSSNGGGMAANARPSAAATAGSGSLYTAGIGCKIGRAVLHADVDSFYCAVERLDDPSLVGQPLAVGQFNGGGFVSVSYEVCQRACFRVGDTPAYDDHLGLKAIPLVCGHPHTVQPVFTIHDRPGPPASAAATALALLGVLPSHISSACRR